MQMLLFISFLGVLIYEYAPFSIQSASLTITNIPGFLGDRNLISPSAQAGSASLFDFEFIQLIDAATPSLAFIWIIGALIMLFRFATNLFYIQNLRNTGISEVSNRWNDIFTTLKNKSGVKKQIRFLESTLIKSPLTIGHIKPLILIPAGMLMNMPSEQVEAVILHELAHIKRSDYLLNIIQNLVESLIFFHPVTWILSENIKREREHICDDYSVGTIKNPIDLAKALFEIEKNKAIVPDLALGAGKGMLINRINRIVNLEERGKRNYYGIVPAILLILFLAISPAFHMKSVEKDPENENTETVSNVSKSFPEVVASDQKKVIENNQMGKYPQKTEKQVISLTVDSEDQEIALKTTNSEGEKIDIVFTSPEDIRKLKIDGKKIDSEDYDKYLPMLQKEVFSKFSGSESKEIVISRNGKYDINFLAFRVGCF
jgi:beta-lactamase regulating signal transducer with metallopeptidase domain